MENEEQLTIKVICNNCANELECEIRSFTDNGLVLAVTFCDTCFDELSKEN